MAANDRLGACANWPTRLARGLPWLLALLPPLYLIVVLLTLTVDVPFADQWALVPLLEHSYRGRLSFGELWAQHNEHRLLFPRLLMLGLARLTGWSTRAEMLTNVALAVGLFAVLLWQARGLARAAGLSVGWLAALLSLMVFSLNQAESWWGGWNIQIFLCVLCASLALVLLARPAQCLWTLTLALGCGVVAAYSYSTGLLVWPLGSGLLLVAVGRAKRGWPALLLWSLAGGLVLAGFLRGYTWTAQAPVQAEVLGHAGRYLAYTLAYLGAPATRGAVEYLFGMITGDGRAICDLGGSDLCQYVSRAALTAGLAGLLLFGLLVWALARQLTMRPLLPLAALGLYAIATGAATSLGRASYGLHQALAQRYATSASLLWVALALMLALYAQLQPGRWRRQAAQATLAALALCIALATLQGPDHFGWQHDFLVPARAELFRLQDDALLRRLYFDPQAVRAGVPLLRQHRLAVFR